MSLYPVLLSPLQLGPVRLRNRVVFAGHGSRFVDWNNHHLTERQGHYLAERAKGGVGMIIQGSSMVHPTGLAAAGVNEIWSDESIPAYARVVDMIHEHGAAVFGQLSHLGRQGNTFAAHRELWAPSPIPDPASRVVPHAMTIADISELTAAYREGARRLVEAGFDGIEVYLAHGYLLCEFLSPFSNRRDDQYGGSLENRSRLPLEVLEAVNSQVGDNVAVGIRVSAEEFSPDGIDPEECNAIVEYLLARQRVDYVSVSQSNYASMETMIPDMAFDRAPFAHYAAKVREVCNGVPVLTVARLVTPEKCEELLSDGIADGVCLVRPLIADPEWVNKAAEGRREDLRECISCNVGCRGGPHRGSQIACLVNPAVGYEETWGIGNKHRAKSPRRVVVVGGGAAGLKTAEIAAERGHEVELFEASEVLGGQVLVAAATMPYRDEFANSVRFLAARCRSLGVSINLETRVDAEMITAIGPDAVVIATGSSPGRPDIDGAELLVTAHHAIRHGVEGHRIIVVDSGEADWKVATTAERLASDGHEVVLVTPVSVGAEMDAFSRPGMLRRLRQLGVEFVERHILCSVEPGRAYIQETLTGTVSSLEADQVVVAWYGVADDALHTALQLGPAPELHLVGDALAPRRAIDAIWDGHRIAHLL